MAEAKESLELTIRTYYNQRRMDATLLELKLYPPNYKAQFFGMLENYDAFGIRQIYKMAVYEELLATYPKDWWQAFKGRWFPSWLKKIFPVTYMEIKAEHKFPHWEKDLGTEYVQITQEIKENT